MHIPRTIYAIRHNVTGRVYVGSSAAPIKRIRSHLNALRRGKHNNSAMQSDFDLYGDDCIPIIIPVGNSFVVSARITFFIAILLPIFIGGGNSGIIIGLAYATSGAEQQNGDKANKQ